ncbi:MAG TPA: SGNH/GDSL hydrolase family protein [Terriglobia bacterium]|nr:SGNH/GDSL hydrolase family protein [Terriglobia bacterium]
MKRSFAFTLGVLLALPAGLSAGTISQIVVFGDSLSDTGNLYIATGGLPPAPAPPLYTKGLFTDGPDSTPSTSGPLGIWVQQLAGMIGVASPAPYLAGTGGTDYAFGGALTGHDPNPAGVPYVTDQLDAYLAGHLSGVPSTALYAFWAGANDIFQGMSPATAVANLTGNINTLFDDGGRHFLWLDMPPLGDTPDGLALGGAGSAALNLFSQEYNADWLTAIALLDAQDPGINIVDVNVYGLVEAMLADPSKYGFVNVDTPAQGLSVDPNTYLFWDGVHPTTEGDFQVASLAEGDLATPEPSTVVLVSTALLAAAFMIKRRQDA